MSLIARTTLVATLLGSVAAHADEEPKEVVEVTAPPGKAPRPSLDIRIGKDDFNLVNYDMRFPSGLRVIFQRDTSEPIVAITSVTDHGSSDDPLGKEGIAHLVEHLWFRSEHGGLPKVWDLLESEMGCSLNAFTQYDITAYMTACGSHEFDAMMKLESLRMTDTVRGVTQDMVTTEVEVVRNEIRMRGENFNIPFFTVWEYVNKTLFPEGHPYHRPVAGDHTTIRNCKVEDVQKFTGDYYKPENTTVMVVGDIPLSGTDANVHFFQLLDVLVRNFDLKLLDPRLTDIHIRPMAKTGIKNPDPKNPDHWWLVPMDPGNPARILDIKVNQPSRASKFAGLRPLEPLTTKLTTYEGPVEHPTVAVAWTMPPGYQGDDTLLQISGLLLSNTVQSGLQPYGNDVYKNPDIREFQGCGALPSKQATVMICAATMKDADGNATSIADDMIDQISNLLAQEQQIEGVDFLKMGIENAKSGFLAQMLVSSDLYAAIGAGRATDTGQWAHFTGSPAYYKQKMEEISALQAMQIRELVGTWIQRKRATTVLIKPMKRDDVALASEDTAGSGGHYRGGGEASILKPSIDPAALTPDLIRNIISLPDTSRIDDYTLSNGLRVVVMPHGEAPLVSAHLIAYGGNAIDPQGILRMTDRFTDFDVPDQPLRLAGGWEGGMGQLTDDVGIRGYWRNLDGLLWMLRERIDTQKISLEGKADWIGARRSELKKNWKDADWQIRHMRAEHLNPGHPTNDTIDWADLEVLSKASASAMTADLQRRWQPANATLVIVGRVDPGEARRQVMTYFGGWQPASGVTAQQVPPIPAPNAAKPQAIYVFDDEGKTQTQVTLTCPLKPTTEQPSPAHEVLGDIASMTLFSELRERAGVVYSPGAGVRLDPSGAATMFMTAAIQNDSAVFALQHYLKFLDKAAAGGLSETDLRVKKLSRASGYVVDQQNIDQMYGNRLAPTVARRQPWSSFDRYADHLAGITLGELADISQGCAEHAFITFKGPKEKVAAQLDAAGMKYEIVDVTKQYEDWYGKVDPKGFAAYQKQKAKDEAKKKKEEEEKKDEGTSEGSTEPAKGD